MLKSIKSILFLSLLVSLTVACDKENENTNTSEENITDEEVVALLEGAILTESSGVASEALDATYTAEQYIEKTTETEVCNMTFDSTVVRSFGTARITTNYTSQWEWTVFCNALDIPTSLNWGRTTSGTYETQRLSSEDSSTTNWTVDNLIIGENFVLNGTYQRNGSQVSMVRNQNTFTSELAMTVTDLVVSKNEQNIVGGLANWTLTGESSSGESFSREGSIEFLGNGLAEVTINGETFQIDFN